MNNVCKKLIVNKIIINIHYIGEQKFIQLFYLFLKKQDKMWSIFHTTLQKVLGQIMQELKIDTKRYPATI